MIDFNRSETNPLKGKVDLSQLAEIGPGTEVKMGWDKYEMFTGTSEAYMAKKLKDGRYQILSHCYLGVAERPVQNPIYQTPSRFSLANSLC